MLPVKEGSIAIDPKGEIQITGLNIPFGTGDGWKAQHLYLVSDELIKEDDYRYCSDETYGGVWKFTKGQAGLCSKCKKIETTTDKSLGLPSIPEEWIRDVYIPAQGNIDKVRIQTSMFNPVIVVHNQQNEVIILPMNSLIKTINFKK